MIRKTLLNPLSILIITSILAASDPCRASDHDLHHSYPTAVSGDTTWYTGDNGADKSDISLSGAPAGGTIAQEREISRDEADGEMYPLLFVIIALIIGAGTRHWLRKSPLPYTVSLLLSGLLLGALNRMGLFGTYTVGEINLNIDFMAKALEWAGNIHPHLILFVFLPTLIFEAAYAMDLHTFRKTSTNAFLLAVPGILVALAISASFVMLINYLGWGFEGWGWTMALLFGAVISANDPVAVVALLKDLGASKKLGTLIEGESLLNDGTAIVLFMVLLAAVTGTGTDGSPLMEFLKVALGGIFIGFLFGWVTLRWVRRVFNDAMIEITVIIAAAYLTFFVAEHFFHVSGVLGLVTLGVMMAGIGKTRISPEVQHFLHEFWELAAFIANTLIFVIVGVVIAKQTVLTLNNLFMLGLIYLAIHIARAVVVTLLYPLMKNTGYGLNRKNALVLWWGALRGAIGLALALIVAGEESIPVAIREQFLFITAGIVLLTLLINATTIKALLNTLGLTKMAPAKIAMINSAYRFLRQTTGNSIVKSKRDRFLNRANWERVREYLPEEPAVSTADSIKSETAIAETRLRVLEKEKSSYWSQFNEGMLGSGAVRKLTETINEIIDKGGEIPLSEREDLESEWKTPRLLAKLQSLPVAGSLARRLFTERLATGYDSARGFVIAQEEALKLLGSISISSESDISGLTQNDLEILENEINENKIHGLTYLRNLRNSYPEIYSAVSTRYAIRTTLNYEKRGIEKLRNRGRLGTDETAGMIKSVEERMKRLMDSPPSYEIPGPTGIMAEVPWIKELTGRAFSRTMAQFQPRLFPTGETVVKEGGLDDGLYIITSGQVNISAGSEKIELLGPGAVVGEMMVLTGLPRTATVTAIGEVSTMWISSSKLHTLMKEIPSLADQLWLSACSRFAENILGNRNPYSQWQKRDLRQWLHGGDVVKVGKGEKRDLDKESLGILLSGEMKCSDDQILRGPSLLMSEKKYLALSSSRLYIREIRTP